MPPLFSQRGGIRWLFRRVLLLLVGRLGGSTELPKLFVVEIDRTLRLAPLRGLVELAVVLHALSAFNGNFLVLAIVDASNDRATTTHELTHWTSSVLPSFSMSSITWVQTPQ